MSQKKTLLCVTGGIAAYKACEVLRLFQKSGHDLRVAMTKEAEQFVTALTFQALSGKLVHTNLFDASQESQMTHIDLADWADQVVICPATANIIAKIAHGFADDLISTLVLATKAKIFLTPSMNVNMWTHPATQINVKTLKDRGIQIIDPEEGELACGWTGQGRLAAPETIVKFVNDRQ